jgi:hypothetical protein
LLVSVSVSGRMLFVSGSVAGRMLLVSGSVAGRMFVSEWVRSWTYVLMCYKLPMPRIKAPQFIMYLHTHSRCVNVTGLVLVALDYSKAYITKTSWSSQDPTSRHFP